MTGWFVLAITFYFFVIFFIFGGIEIIRYYLNDLIKFKSKNMIGDTLGLTEKECIEDDIAHNTNEEEVGTTNTEFRDIQNKKVMLSEKYSSTFLSISNTVKITSEVIFPIVLWCFGSLKLYIFLESVS